MDTVSSQDKPRRRTIHFKYNHLGRKWLIRDSTHQNTFAIMICRPWNSLLRYCNGFGRLLTLLWVTQIKNVQTSWVAIVHGWLLWQPGLWCVLLSSRFMRSAPWVTWNGEGDARNNTQEQHAGKLYIMALIRKHYTNQFVMDERTILWIGWFIQQFQ